MSERVGPTDWDEVLENLEEHRATARSMGGEIRLKKHRDAGKLDARAAHLTRLVFDGVGRKRTHQL